MAIDNFVKKMSKKREARFFDQCIGEKKYCNPAKSNCQIQWMINDYKGYPVYYVSYHKEETKFETGDTFSGFFIPVNLCLPFLKIDIHKRREDDFLVQLICKKNVTLSNDRIHDELYIEIKNQHLVNELRENPEILDYPLEVFKSIPSLFFKLNYHKLDCIDELSESPLLCVFVQDRLVETEEEFEKMYEFCQRAIDKFVERKLIMMN
jgi:hypothetical protein